MPDYLGPTDDDLPTRPSGPWAAIKLDYLKRYIDVFETSMRDRWETRYYIDLMAGPGKNRVRRSNEILLGSPLLALTTTHPFSGYFFVDSENRNTSALQSRVATSRYSDRVSIFNGDCNELVDTIVNQIRQGPTSLNLAFLDPEGLELKWEAVAKLSSIGRCDLIINYPQGGIHRYLPVAYQSSSQTAIDGYFGDRSWRDIYEQYQTQPSLVGLHRPLVQHYMQKLRELGYEEVVQGEELEDAPLIRNVQRNAPLYRLLFASKHKLAHKFWKDITSRNVFGQRRPPFCNIYLFTFANGCTIIQNKCARMSNGTG